jgi:pimeloyl-ACP methyl ester carboxylesterase
MRTRTYGIRTTATLLALAAAASPLAATEDPVRPRSFEVQVHGSGPPVILIPGLSCSPAVWEETIDALAAEFELHAVSLAGFGGSPFIEGPLLPRVRDELVAYVREQRLCRPALVGHSLGGFLAFWLEASEPEQFGPMIAVDGVPFLPALRDPGTSEEAQRAGAERMRAMMASLSPEQFSMQNRLSLQAMITDPDDVERIAAVSARSAPAAVAQALYELMTTDLRDDVAAIQAPVLLIAPASPGDLGEALRVRYQAQLDLIADHETLWIDGTRHFVMLDATEQFLAAVRSFLGPGASGAACAGGSR